MASQTYGQLVVELAADVARLRRDMATAKGVLESGAASMRRVASVMRNVFVGVLGGLALAGAGSRIRAAFDWADEARDAAQAAGLTTEQLTRLRFAAEQSGLSQEGLQTGLVRLSKSMADAATGSKEAAAAFGALGVQVTDQSGKIRPLNDVLLDVADAFAALPDGVQKTALSLQIFSRSGSQMIPLLNEGADGLKRMGVEADRLGRTLSQGAADAADEFNDNLNKLNVASTNLTVALVNKLGPALAKFTSDLAENIRQLGVVSGLASTIFNQMRGEASGAELERARVRMDELTREEQRILGDLDRVKRQRFMPDISREQAFKRLNGELDRTRTKMFDVQELMDAISTAGPTPEKPQARAGGIAEEFDRIASSAGKAKTKTDETAEAIKKIFEETRTPLEKVNEEWSRLDDLLQKGAFGKDEAAAWDLYARATLDASDALGEMADRTKEVSDLGADLGLTFSSAFEDAIAGGQKFSQILRALGEDLLRLVTRQLITEPLARSFAGFDFGGLLSSFLPGRATGGTVYPGQAYVVGERGPEVLVPGTAGRVLPGVGGGVTVNVIEAPGRGGQVQQTTRGGRSVVDVMVERIKSAVASDILRGAGPVSSALERTYGATRAAGAF